MHLSALLAVALGLAPVWAVPTKGLAEFDPQSGAIPIERFHEFEKDLKVLKPRRPKKGTKPDFGLKKDIVLNWDDGQEDIIKAELTASWKEQDEVSVINMADFASALEKVDCTAPTLSMIFSRPELFVEAQKSWEWINGGEKNSVIMFANHRSCGEDKAGAPFRVTGIKFDDKQLTAYAIVEEIANLETVIPDGELVVDSIADIDEPIEEAPEDDLEQADASKVSKRQTVSITPSISLNKDFNNKNIFSIGSGNNYLKLDCTTCGSRGKINIKLYTRIRWFSVQESYVEFRAQEVRAFVNLKLHGKGSRNSKNHKVLFPITAYGFQIPGIATLRLAADIGVGYDASLLGEGQVTWGATAMLTNPSVMRQCFKGCNHINSGWQITTQQVQPAGSGSLMARISAHTFITPKAEARIFSSGYEVGIALLAPKFDGTALVAANSDGGICAHPKAILGVDIDVKVGLQCYVYAGPNYQSPNWQRTLYERMWTLYDECFILARKP
ncbi:hypothetical protein V8F06_013130 [Rhypophila decipiens]